MKPSSTDMLHSASVFLCRVLWDCKRVRETYQNNLLLLLQTESHHKLRELLMALHFIY